MQVFFRICTRILTRAQGKMFEDLFLVKIANKASLLRSRRVHLKSQERDTKLVHKLQ